MQQPHSPSVPLLHVHRAGAVESIHRGSYVVLQGDRVLEQVGDVESSVFYRSTAKPFQAMVAVTSGAAARFDFQPRDLAIAAGSHNAAPKQLEAVQALLKKADLDESLLRCGGHWSIDPARARRQVSETRWDLEPLPTIWSNCSGKHAAMLAAARAMGAPLEGYLAPDHPVQQAILEIVAAFTDTPVDEVAVGVDGCGAPIFGVPLLAMARSLLRLGDPTALPLGHAPALADAARLVGEAMGAWPEMIAGGKRFDTDLMTSSKALILSKGGAEGVHGIAVPALQLGLAVKVDDGNDRGYRLLVIELLRRLDVLTREEAEGLSERHGRTTRNFGGAEVGRLEVLR